MIATASECPLSLSRLPLFAPYEPGDRQAGDTDWINGEVYLADRLRVTRYGPGLDIYDEDTLLGLLRALQLKSTLAPVKDTAPQGSSHGEAAEADILVCETSAHTINKYLGRSTNNEHLEQCHDSIWRIANTQLLIYRNDLRLEWKTVLFDCSAPLESIAKDFFIQFAPLAVPMLREYRHLDMNVRMQLSAIGKALHRHLSSLLIPGRASCLPLGELSTAIGFKGQVEDFGRAIEKEVKILLATNWLKHGEILGSGQLSDLTLQVTR